MVRLDVRSSLVLAFVVVAMQKKLNDDKIFISSIGLLFNINNVTMDKNSHVLYESSKRIEQHRNNTKNGPRDDDKNE